MSDKKEEPRKIRLKVNENKITIYELESLDDGHMTWRPYDLSCEELSKYLFIRVKVRRYSIKCRTLSNLEVGRRKGNRN